MSDLSYLTHVQSIRQTMPATLATTYLNTGTFGPLPSTALDAIQQRLQREWQDGRLGAKSFEELAEIYSAARAAVARLLHADPEEIALTDNTGEGLNIACFGIDWQEGDEVITTDHEHVSALGPLYQIRDRYGISIRKAELGSSAERPLRAAIEELITPRTRLIVLSHVTWTTGTVLDVRSVGRLGRERGLPVVVDGAQSAGAIPINVKELEVDFYAIPMQKWLCGPDGTGALYACSITCRPIKSTYVGYWSIAHEEPKEGEEKVDWQLLGTAQRFEVGGRQTAAIAGQGAVLRWLEEFVGHDWLYKRISALNSYACRVLQSLPGLTLLTPTPGASGIVSFTIAGLDEAKAVERLRNEHNIVIRTIPETHALRVSTGFYNTEEEIDKLVEALKSL